MIWKGVSSNYSAVFFRVVGGEAAPFGEIQKENTTRIVSVNAEWSCDKGGKDAYEKVHAHISPDQRNADIPLVGSSLYVEMGRDVGNCQKWTSFKSSGGEVRPKNMAIKVWRRII